MKMDDILTIGLPSKGRLKKDTEDYFQKIGLPITTSGGEREYVGHFKGFDNHTILFLQPSQIAARLADGTVDCGVTGHDLISEAGADQHVFTFEKLGFGFADLVIAIPETWIDVHSIRDLDDIMFFFRRKHHKRFRIATKYIHLTSQFLKQNSITDYRIIKSSGATEGTIASGDAEAIVDITSTGKTIKSNALKIIPDGIILKSEALFMGSLRANWSDNKFVFLKKIIDFITAHNRAMSFRLVTGSFSKDSRLDILDHIIHYKGQNIDITDSFFSCLIHHQDIHAFSEIIRSLGANTITIQRCDTIFNMETPLLNDFAQSLKEYL